MIEEEDGQANDLPANQEKEKPLLDRMVELGTEVPLPQHFRDG